MSNLFLLNILMALIWGAVTGNFGALNLAFAFVLGAIALWLIREQFATATYFIRAWLIIVLGYTFLHELTLATLRVVKIVWSPGISEVKAGFIAFPLTCTRNIEITLLSMLITLTPGTLSVDISDDRSTLYIHALDVPDVDNFREDLAKGFERMIMEALR